MEHISKIAFPGFGIGEFELSNVAFDLANVLGFFGIKISSFPVYWYGVIITCGMILAFLYVVYRGKYEGVKSDDITDIALWTVIIGVIGARLYYVLTKIDNFLPKGEFNLFEFLKNVANLRTGGLAIYGGIIAGASTIIVVTIIKKINSLKLWDMAAPAVMIGQSLGRWGNFCNGEAFGAIVEEGHPLYFLRMGLISNNTVSTFATNEMVYVHPTFLYESLWNIAGFVLINLSYKKKKFNGQIAFMYLAWYGIGRFFIEGLRTDSLYVPGTAIRISQMVGILCFVVFGLALVAGLIYSYKKLSVEGEPLTAFDRYLKPQLVENPVYFEKKENKDKNDGSENESDSDIDNDNDNDFDVQQDNLSDNTEDGENGTNN